MARVVAAAPVGCEGREARGLGPLQWGGQSLPAQGRAWACPLPTPRCGYGQDLSRIRESRAVRPEDLRCFSQERRLTTRAPNWALGPFLEVGGSCRKQDYEACNPEGGHEGVSRAQQMTPSSLDAARPLERPVCGAG